MTAINFPDSPTPDELFSAAGRTWQWNDTDGVWETVASTSIPPAAHATSHEDGGSDELEIAPVQVTGTAVVDSDSRLTDARTPTAHAASHGSAGSDAITISSSQVTTSTSDKSVNYTLLSTDENTYIRSTGSAITITVPDVLADGESVNFIQAGAGQITFAGDAITINSKDAKLKTAAQFSGATITKLGGAYYLVGDLGE